MSEGGAAAVQLTAQVIGSAMRDELMLAWRAENQGMAMDQDSADEIDNKVAVLGYADIGVAFQRRTALLKDKQSVRTAKTNIDSVKHSLIHDMTDAVLVFGGTRLLETSDRTVRDGTTVKESLHHWAVRVSLNNNPLYTTPL